MIVIDIETTGLDPLKHSILDIGALDFNNPNNHFFQKCKILSHEEVDVNALKVNGYDEKQLFDSEKQTLKDLLLNFIEWLKPIKNKTLTG